MNTFGKPLLTMVVALGLLSLPASAQDAHDEQIVAMPDTLEWQDGPPTLPPGAQVVVIEGSPSEEGPLTLRLKFPANYEVPPHMHPALEHITVLEGTFNFGMGDVLDRSQTTALTVGGFVIMPIGHTHYVWTDEETIVQLHSTGPFSISYVDPADDPRNQ
jgi:quercetin dioxygenase-like cupin family protein